jgi:hypothetical protein
MKRNVTHWVKKGEREEREEVFHLSFDIYHLSFAWNAQSLMRKSTKQIDAISMTNVK